MTDVNQDFTVYAGDAAAITFTIKDAAGAPLDLSGAADIVWVVQRSEDDTAALTKSKTGGGVVLVGGGTGGQCQALVTGADSTALAGFYLHKASVTDGSGNVTTVTLGRLEVFAIGAWAYSGDPTLSSKDGVRFLIGDTNYKDKLVPDKEIAFAVSRTTSIDGAAAMCCRSLAARFAREVDSVDAQLRTMWSSRSRQFIAMAVQLELQASVRGRAMPYAGGISRADRNNQILNDDRVPPQANIGMQDNHTVPGGADVNEDGS